MKAMLTPFVMMRSARGGDLMKVATCGADMVTLQDGRVLLSPQYCHGNDCKVFPCTKCKVWAKWHGVLDVVKAISRTEVKA